MALVAVAAVALVLFSQHRPLSLSPEHVSAIPPRPAQAQAQLPDAGTAAVGDTSPTEPHSSPPPPKQQSVSQDPPFIPGSDQPRRQARPDAQGRCQGPKQVVFNGFCWLELSSLAAEECTAGGYLFLKGKCYGPALELPQKALPTSGPGDAR